MESQEKKLGKKPWLFLNIEFGICKINTNCCTFLFKNYCSIVITEARFKLGNNFQISEVRVNFVPELINAIKKCLLKKWQFYIYWNKFFIVFLVDLTFLPWLNRSPSPMRTVRLTGLIKATAPVTCALLDSESVQIIWPVTWPKPLTVSRRRHVRLLSINRKTAPGTTFVSIWRRV